MFNAHVPICMMSSVPMQTVALARGATAFFSKAGPWSQRGGLLGKLRAQPASLDA